ncbi:MAG: MshQ-like protein, partial [Marinobacter sp.]|nr:MshQ-like protein [Marinobacter sp.]
MRPRHFSCAMLAVLFALFLVAPPAWAAQCSDVFGAPSGVNSNLQASGNTLDLSGVPWANNPWPASGTTLAAGDYYFGSASLGNGYQLNVADGAQVRIFINGSQGFGNNIAINADGDPGQLLLVTRGSLTLGNNAQVNGLLYAAGSISVGNNAVITGGLAAGGGISVGNTGPVADYSGIEQGLLAGLCARPVELSANGDSVGPVAVEVGESVLLSVRAEGCVAAGTPLYQEWTDRWLIDGAEVQSSISTTSICNRSPLNWNVSFDAPGDYIVRFESSFRTCFLIFCGGEQQFGQDEILIRVTDPNDGLTCFVDDFDGGSLSTNDWVTSVASGSFTPSVVNNRLRMTQAVSNQSTAATLQREIPGADNLVILEFDYFAYGGSGADGLAIVLSDSAITPQPGSFGGSLGYAQRNNGDPGFAGGWLGIGLDEFGNFSNPTEGRQGGPGSRPDAVAIRGAYQGNYRYLRGTNTLSPGIDQAGTNPTAQRYRIIVDSRLAGQAIVSVERDISGSGNNFQTLIAPFNALAEPGQPAVPENFLLSLTGSTGGSTNIHELGNIELCALKLNPVGQQV